MTYDECVESDSDEARKVREIVKKIRNVKFPEDLIIYQIMQQTSQCAGCGECEPAEGESLCRDCEDKLGKADVDRPGEER